MRILFRFGKELFWTIFWVFVALIVGYLILHFIENRNIPVLAPIASWTEKRAQGGS